MTFVTDKNNKLSHVVNTFRLGELARFGWGNSKSDFVRYALNCKTSQLGSIYKREGSYLRDKLPKQPDAILSTNLGETLLLFDMYEAGISGRLYLNNGLSTYRDINFNASDTLLSVGIEPTIVYNNSSEIYLKLDDVFKILIADGTVTSVTNLYGTYTKYDLVRKSDGSITRLSIGNTPYQTPISNFYLDSYDNLVKLSIATLRIYFSSGSIAEVAQSFTLSPTIGILNEADKKVYGTDSLVDFTYDPLDPFGSLQLTSTSGGYIDLQYSSPIEVDNVYNFLQSKDKINTSMVGNPINITLFSNVVSFNNHINLQFTPGTLLSTVISQKPVLAKKFSQRMWLISEGKLYFSEPNDFNNYGTNFSNVYNLSDMGEPTGVAIFGSTMVIGTKNELVMVENIIASSGNLNFSIRIYPKVSVVENGVISFPSGLIIVTKTGIYKIDKALFSFIAYGAYSPDLLRDLTVNNKHFFDVEVMKAWKFKNFIMMFRKDSSYVLLNFYEMEDIIAGCHYKFSQNRTYSAIIQEEMLSFVGYVKGEYYLASESLCNPMRDNEPIELKTSITVNGNYNYLDFAKIRVSGISGMGIFRTDDKLEIVSHVNLTQPLTTTELKSNWDNSIIYIRFKNDDTIYKFTSGAFDDAVQLYVTKPSILTRDLTGEECELLGVEVSFTEAELNEYKSDNNVVLVNSTGETYNVIYQKDDFRTTLEGLYVSIGYDYNSYFTIFNFVFGEFYKFDQAAIHVFNTPFLFQDVIDGRESRTTDIINGDVSDGVYRIGTACFDRFSEVDPRISFRFEKGCFGCVSSIKFNIL